MVCNKAANNNANSSSSKIGMSKTFDTEDLSEYGSFHNNTIQEGGGVEVRQPQQSKLTNTTMETMSNVDDEDEEHETLPLSKQEEEESPEEQQTVSTTNLQKAIEGFKYIYSMLLLLFSIFLAMAAIFTEQTIATANDGMHPVLVFFIFWFLICWLAAMEGGQGCLVGLHPVDKNLYKETHPITYKNTNIVYKGDNLERFIVGRQFLVVLVVFLSSMMSSAIPEIDLFGLPHVLTEIMLNSGFALIFITITIGQLTAQVNAANCMLDFVNNYFVLYFVTYMSLAIEFSGLLHSVYLIQSIFARISGNPIDSKEPPKTYTQQIFFWGRVILSLTVLGYAFAVTISALFAGMTTMWEGVPPTVSVILFFVLMCFAGLMEGMQIALFAVVNLPDNELEKYPVAYKNCNLAFQGQNLQSILIGRQILVTVCMFVVAQISTLAVEIGVDDNIFGVSDGVQSFFNTGLLGAVITTIIASLAWRVVASSLPIPFLSNPLIYLIIRLCLILEASGLCSAAWLLAAIHGKIAGFQLDGVYIGKSKHSDGDIEDQSANATIEVDLATESFMGLEVVSFDRSLG